MGAGTSVSAVVAPPMLVNAPSIVYTVPAGGAGTYTFERPGYATLSCTLAPVGPVEDTSPTQNGFSTEEITAQLSSLSNAVSNNVKGVLNGGTNPSLNRNGFFLQSMGLAARRSRGSAPEWNVWVKGDFNSFDGNALSGSQANLVLGIDHQTDPDTVVGGMLSYDVTDFTTNIAGAVGALKADGYTIGVYGGRRLDGGLLIDGMLAY